MFPSCSRGTWACSHPVNVETLHVPVLCIWDLDLFPSFAPATSLCSILFTWDIRVFPSYLRGTSTCSGSVQVGHQHLPVMCTWDLMSSRFVHVERPRVPVLFTWDLDVFLSCLRGTSNYVHMGPQHVLFTWDLAVDRFLSRTSHRRQTLSDDISLLARRLESAPVFTNPPSYWWSIASYITTDVSTLIKLIIVTSVNKKNHS